MKEWTEIQDIDGLTHEAYVFRHNKNTTEQLAVDIHSGYLFSFTEDDTNMYTSTREQYLLQQTINLSYLTKTRCYELVEDYLE